LSHAADLIHALGLNPTSDKHPSNIVFATGVIPTGYTTGWPTITFDGESTTGSRQYPYLSSYSPVAGDRVILAMLTHSGVIMGKIGGQPTGSTAPGGVSSLNALSVIDTRNIATTPATYSSETAWNFKASSTIGLPSSAGNWCAVMGVAPWSDDSSGNWEVAYTSSGAVFIRYGTRAGGWQTWTPMSIPGGATAQLPIWQTVTYQNGYSDWNDGNYGNPLVYSRDSSGIVRIRGMVNIPSSGAATNQVMFNFPVGFRPGKYLLIPCTSGDAFMSMQVGATGDVSCRNTPTASGWISLDAISFIAEQ